MLNYKLNFQKNRSLKNGLPNMRNTLTGWEQPITLIKIVQNIVEGELIATPQNIEFMGVVQPLRDEQLISKPENMRSWQWIWIHCKAGDLNLQTADKIIYNSIRFKVMAVKDYSDYGYIEYELCEDFTGTND